jgi:hypothetical protein
MLEGKARSLFLKNPRGCSASCGAVKCVSCRLVAHDARGRAYASCIQQILHLLHLYRVRMRQGGSVMERVFPPVISEEYEKQGSGLLLPLSTHMFRARMWK